MRVTVMRPVWTRRRWHTGHRVTPLLGSSAPPLAPIHDVVSLGPQGVAAAFWVATGVVVPFFDPAEAPLRLDTDLV